MGSEVTIDQVAAICGVSKTTISRYLNHKYENISAETRQRIEQVITELNYRPNREAASRPENDFYVFTDRNPSHQSIILKHGDFLVAFPEDAHRVKGQVSGPSDVRKVVFKIRIG